MLTAYTLYAMRCPCKFCVTAAVLKTKYSYCAAAYLSHFRADAIVADAEAIRASLIGPDGKWSLLGQSFGEAAASAGLARATGQLNETARIRRSDEARLLNFFFVVETIDGTKTRTARGSSMPPSSPVAFRGMFNESRGWGVEVKCDLVMAVYVRS